jgi:hypothetical protein
MQYHIWTISAVDSDPDAPLECELIQNTGTNGDALFLVRLSKQFDHLNGEDCTTLLRWRLLRKNELVAQYYHPYMIKNVLEHVALIRKEALEMIRQARAAQAQSQMQVYYTDYMALHRLHDNH